MRLSVAPSPARNSPIYPVVVVLVLGLYAQVAQALLIRELLAIFHGNELAIGVFFCCWLFWIGLGGRFAVFLSRQGRVLVGSWDWMTLVALLPWLLALQIVFVRLLRFVFTVPAGQWLGLGSIMFSTGFLVLPAGFLLGLLLPMACRAVDPLGARPVTRLFVAEALGALVGSALATFVFILLLGPVRILGILLVLLSALVWVAPKSFATTGRWCKGVAGGGALFGVLLLTPLGEGINGWLDELRFHGMHPQMHRLAGVETRYGLVELAGLEGEISTVNDGAITASFPAPRRNLLDAAWVMSQRENVGRVLQIGGFHRGLTRELLDYPIQKLVLLLEDQQGFNVLKPYLHPQQLTTLADPRLRVNFDDGRAWARQTAGKEDFDLAVVLVGDPTSIRHNRFYTIEFYKTIKSLLTQKGVVCTWIGGSANYLGREAAGPGASVWATLGKVFPYRVLVPGDELSFCASHQPLAQDPETVLRNFTKVKPPNKILPEATFLDMLPEKRIAFTRAHLERRDLQINTDSLPVTYFYNLLLWSRFSVSWAGEFLVWLKDLTIWPYCIPALFAALIPVISSRGKGPARLGRFRHNTALFSLGGFGFVTMVAQLVILLSFQLKIGVVFSRVALINGLFMAGLVVGAAGLGRWLLARGSAVRGLVGIHWVMGGFCLLLPEILGVVDGFWQELLHYGVATLTGIFGGAAYPLAVAMVHDRQRASVVTSGLVNGWDHWGGALGAMVAGLFMIPLLGSAQTLHILAFVIILPVGGLWLIGFPRLWQRAWLGRVPSFPWQGLVWALLMITLSTGLLTGLARYHGLTQQTTFDESVLRDVSGSVHLETKTDPWSYHVGWDDDGKPKTVTLSSLTVAADIRGYAGSIHLLISVTENGQLRGVRLIHSEETAAYVQGMERWLERFKGVVVGDPGFVFLGLDGLSGATITRKAALKTIEKTATHGLHQAFGRDIPLESSNDGQWPPLSFWATGVVVVLGVVVYFRNRPREILWQSVASVIILGFTFNVLWTELDLVNVSLGHVGGWENHQAWWLLGGMALVSTLLAGPVYCSFVCPFGTLQELVSRLGRWLGIGQKGLHPKLERLGLFWKYFLLAVIVIFVWVGEETRFAAYNPMQSFFSFGGESSLGPLTVMSLASALIFYRYWCRYWCPMGAFLALGNRLAWLERYLPGRFFNRCDLGAKHRHHVECIRCGRCASMAKGGTKVRTWGWNDVGFVALMSLTAGAVVYHLTLDSRMTPEGGFRRVDTVEIRRQVESGRLSGQKASWYRSQDETKP